MVIVRQSHDIVSIVALSCVVGRKLDMHLFCSTIFIVSLSCGCRGSVLPLSCDCHAINALSWVPTLTILIKKNRTTVARLSYDNPTTVARHSWYGRMIVSRISKFRTILTQHWLSVVRQWYVRRATYFCFIQKNTIRREWMFGKTYRLSFKEDDYSTRTITVGPAKKTPCRTLTRAKYGPVSVNSSPWTL